MDTDTDDTDTDPDTIVASARAQLLCILMISSLDSKQIVLINNPLPLVRTKRYIYIIFFLLNPKNAPTDPQVCLRPCSCPSAVVAGGSRPEEDRIL